MTDRPEPDDEPVFDIAKELSKLGKVLPSELLLAARLRNPHVDMDFEVDPDHGYLELVVKAGERTLRGRRPPGEPWFTVFRNLELL